MEQRFVDGRRVPVTCFIVPTHRAIVPVGESAVLLAIGTKKRKASKPIQGLINKFKLDFTPRIFKQSPTVTNPTPEQLAGVDISLLLTPNTLVKVTATSKGKGFGGWIKRWGFATQPRTHGQSDRHRGPGSLGRRTTPGRVVLGKKMAGHLGNTTATVKTLSILDFDKEKNILVLKGTTPGGRNSLTKITLPQSK